MPVISVRIPQMGEGLQEALLVEFLKQPGDEVKRDEPIYVMETDKATTDVESPYEGTVVEWTAEPGSVLPIGNEVGRMEVADGVKEMSAGHGPADDTAGNANGAAADTSRDRTKNESVPRRTDVKIPPRTKKYLKEKGILELAGEIPVSGTKMMPEDVDKFLKARESGEASPATSYTPRETDDFTETELPRSQTTLNYRLVRGSTACVPVTVMSTVNWESIHRVREQMKSKDDSAPSAFALMLWCVSDTIRNHPRFRSSLVGDGRFFRTYKHVNLGIAVGLPGDELVTAVVSQADTLAQSEFFSAVRGQIDEARSGNDQADASVSVSVSNIGSAGMRWGIPAIVSPAVATLALGEIYDQPVPDGDSFRFVKTAELTLSFDHRVMNGVGAADFMTELKDKIENFEIS